MDNRLERQVTFLKEIDQMKRIQRRSFIADGSRRETDAEHSWHLAMLAEVLRDYFPDADPFRVTRMVLIHDLVEIDAGDTFLYDTGGRETQQKREEAAADRIFAILPEPQAASLRALWDEFERQKSPDARCARMLDRLQPLLQNIWSGGGTWTEHGITLDQVEEANRLLLNEAPPPIAALVRGLLEQAEAAGWLRRTGDA